MVAPEFSIANPSFVNSQINPYMNISNIERPPDTAVNIQHSWLLSQSSTRGPCSPSLLSMDSSPPSEMDYTERMTTNNNRMDIEMLNPKTSGPHMGFPIKMPQLTPDHNEVVSNTQCNPTFQQSSHIIPTFQPTWTYGMVTLDPSLSLAQINTH